MDSWIFIWCCGLYLIIIIIYFVTLLSKIWSLAALSSWLLYSSRLPLPLSKHFLVSGNRRDVRPLLDFLYTGAEANISPTNPGSLYWSTVLRNQNLGARRTFAITLHILRNRNKVVSFFPIFRASCDGSNWNDDCQQSQSRIHPVVTSGWIQGQYLCLCSVLAMET